MSQDFTTTLGRQLREAAERESTRGRFRVRGPERRTVLVVAALLVAAALVVAAVSLAPRREVPAKDRALHVVTRVAIVDHGGELTTAFGSLWTYDAVRGEVLRLSLDGTIAAHIPVAGNLVGGEAGAGAMWAITDSRLYRIDPRTNRVVARIPLPPPSRNFALALDTGFPWIGDTSRLLPLNLATNRFGRPVGLERGGEAARGIGAGSGAFFVLRADGLLETLDGRTGRRLTVAHPAVAGVPLLGFGSSLLVESGAGVAALDPDTGALRWRVNLGTSTVNWVTAGLGAVWVQGTPVQGRDQLWKLDQRTGRVLATLPLADFGATGMTTAGGALWIASPAGNLTEIR